MILSVLANEGKQLCATHNDVSRPAHSFIQNLCEWETNILFLKHDGSIFRQASNPACGFSTMKRVRICAVWPNWLSHEPHTGLEECLNVLLSCFRKDMSGGRGMVAGCGVGRGRCGGGGGGGDEGAGGLF